MGSAGGFSEKHDQGIEEVIREDFGGAWGDVVTEPDLGGSWEESPEEHSEYVRRRVKEGQEHDHPEMGVHLWLEKSRNNSIFKNAIAEHLLAQDRCRDIYEENIMRKVDSEQGKSFHL